VLALAAALPALLTRPRPTGTPRALLLVAVLATVAHTAVTAFAAPLNFSQRDASNSEDLTRILDQFAHLNLLRAALQTAALAALAWTLMSQDRRPSARRAATDTAPAVTS